jgi:hypothetical protein
MKSFFSGLKRWWLRRFRGYVAPPAGSGGTPWQQHPRSEWGFTCRCGTALAFDRNADLVIRSQEHREDCEHQYVEQPKQRCVCPITDARYVKICPQCHLGHWKEAV